MNANILRNKVRAAMNDWVSSGYKNENEQIAAFIDQVMQRDMTLLKAQYRDDLEKARLTGIASGSDFYFTSAVPGNFLLSSGWTDFDFDSADYTRSANSSYKFSQSSTRAGGGFFGIFGASGAGGGSSSSASGEQQSHVQFDASSFSMSFQICQVPIVRPWFKTSFLISKLWRFDQNNPEAKSQMVSDGKKPPKGKLVAYPTSMIVIKDLTLRFGQSNGVRDASSSWERTKSGGGGVLSFGPFCRRRDAERLPLRQQQAGNDGAGLPDHRLQVPYLPDVARPARQHHPVGVTMDAAVQLALMAKAKKVFGTEGGFLSFPVAPLPYTRAQLEFFDDKDADAARASDQNLAQFSALVNLIPPDEAWLPTETVFLWQVYEEVLKGVYASANRTDEEEAAYQAAGAFLGSVPAGGGWEDSPAVKAYKTFEDAARVAQEQYLAAKSTAESSTDPEQQKRWREVDEPAVRASLDALNAKWLTEGQKNEVEQARARRANLGARSPLQTWQQWKSRFNADIDTVTDTSNFTVYPSPFAPRNALDEGAWKTFQLTRDELPALLQEIPAALKERFGAAAPPPSILSINFEFSSALIQREWFASDALRARFWRFVDAGQMLSDGAAPPRGRCPAYVTAVVFGRHVTMETIGTTPQQPAFESIGFAAAAAGQARLAQIPAERLAQPASVADRLARMMKETPPKLLTTRPVLNIQERAITPPVAAVQAMGAEAGAIGAIARTAQLESIAAVRPILRPPAKNGPAVVARINPRQDLARNLPTRPGTPIIPIVRPRKQVTKVTPDDQIFILAFVCKTVGKCPDPDPGLQW